MGQIAEWESGIGAVDIVFERLNVTPDVRDMFVIQDSIEEDVKGSKVPSTFQTACP
jgi:hypothetical protein